MKCGNLKNENLDMGKLSIANLKIENWEIERLEIEHLKIEKLKMFNREPVEPPWGRASILQGFRKPLPRNLL